MKRKVLSVLLCAGLAVSMLAGCGSDSSNANKKAESTGSDLEYVKDKGTLVVGVTNSASTPILSANAFAMSASKQISIRMRKV